MSCKKKKLSPFQLFPHLLGFVSPGDFIAWGVGNQKADPISPTQTGPWNLSPWASHTDLERSVAARSLHRGLGKTENAPQRSRCSLKWHEGSCSSSELATRTMQGSSHRLRLVTAQLLSHLACQAPSPFPGPELPAFGPPDSGSELPPTPQTPALGRGQMLAPWPGALLADNSRATNKARPAGDGVVWKEPSCYLLGSKGWPSES